jgi:type I restriction enzyme S subunit
MSTWRKHKLSQVTTIISGGTPKSGVSEYWGNDVRWITPKDMGQLTSKYVSDTGRRISKLGLDKSSAKLIASNSVILSTRAPIGHLAINTEPMSTNQGCRGLTPTSDLHTKYLYYFIQGSVDLLNELGTGTTFKELSKTALEGVEIPLPPIPEQQRIVAILDQAFADIEKARANAEKNLKNARELFDSYLQNIFQHTKVLGHLNHSQAESKALLNDKRTLDANKESVATKTGGRAATERIVEGKLSLSVGMPGIKPRKNWRWSKLADLARLESGHTPSRRHPEYWDGNIPWVGIKDARKHHGETIQETLQHTNQLGLDNSSARLLPAKTVCLSRTASVGYVFVMGVEMATSQDFVNWVCSDELEPDFLKYLLLAEGRDFSSFSSGSVHQTIYFPEVKAFHICHPEISTQLEIVDVLGKLRLNSVMLADIYKKKLSSLDELKKSLLQKAFSGELTKSKGIAA